MAMFAMVDGDSGWLLEAGHVFAGLVLLIALYFCFWFQYHIDAFMYLLFCKDKKWKSLPDPETRKREAGPRISTTSKTLYFVRHGESTWNATFNRNKLYFLPGLLYALCREAYLTLTAGDSWFYDAPICHDGVKQAEKLRTYLENNQNKPDVQALRHGGNLVVCSNLRRCMSTALISLYDRLAETEERIVMLPCLQEITINPDGLGVTQPGKQPKASWFDRALKGYDMVKVYERNLDGSLNTGNKAITSNGLERLLQFNKWLFSIEEDVVVVNGHSLWFMSYFREFLPRSFKHTGTKKKLKNAAVVKLVVDQCTTADGETFSMIQPDSVQEVFEGFKK